MEVKILEDGAQTVMALSGRLDTVSVGDFEKSVAFIYEKESPDIILECSEFTYISSSGLRIFLTMQKYVMAHSGKMVLRGMRDEIKEVFDMIGFSSIFTIE